MKENDYQELVQHVQEWTRRISEDLDEQAAVSARHHELPSRFLLTYLETVTQRFRLESRDGARSALDRLNESLSGEGRVTDLIVIPSEVEAEVWDEEVVSLSRDLPDRSKVVEQLQDIIRTIRRDIERQS